MKNFRFAQRSGIIVLACFLLICCDENYYPKQKGYFRIQLPVKKYIHLDSIYPFIIDYPAYSRIIADTSNNKEKYWINIEFPQFKGRIYISYKHIQNNLSQYLEDSRNLVNKHIPKASQIESTSYVNDAERVYGLIYDIKGIGAASPFQFYVTDSTTHFVRGSLYFDVAPNNDSLQPVIDFIKKDIIHMINTFKWKK